MTEESSPDPKAEQLSAVRLAQLRVVNGIWASKSLEVKQAFLEIRHQFELGVDVSSFHFWRNNQEKLKKSVECINPMLRETLVNFAFTTLLYRLAQKSEEPVVLFSVPDVGQSEQQTILDAFKFEPDLLEKSIGSPQQQARLDIYGVISKDRFAKTPLIGLDPFAPGHFISDINNASQFIVMPTTMPGVALRYSHPVGKDEPFVEFLPRPAGI